MPYTGIIEGVDTDPSFTVTQLISVFRQGLIALVPIAEAVAITWRDEDIYDDWEHLQDALFTVLVDGTIRATMNRNVSQHRTWISGNVGK